MRGEKVEGSVFTGTILVISCLSKHEVPVMYLIPFPRGNLSTQVRKLIIEMEASGHLSKRCPSWSSWAKTYKVSSSVFLTINTRACHCGRWPLCPGKHTRFHSCTFKEHQVPKKSWGSFSEGCVFCESSFMSRKFHGDHGVTSSQSFTCLCASKCFRLSPCFLLIPFRGVKPAFSYLCSVKKKWFDIRKPIVLFHLCHSSAVSCIRQFPSFSALDMTMKCFDPWSEIELRVASKSCSRKSVKDVVFHEELDDWQNSTEIAFLAHFPTTSSNMSCNDFLKYVLPTFILTESMSSKVRR